MKTKKCKDCKKVLLLKFFSDQPYIAKNPRSDGKRTECKMCHAVKSREAYLKRTTLEQRREYMRNYMKTYRR